VAGVSAPQPPNYRPACCSTNWPCCSACRASCWGSSFLFLGFLLCRLYFLLIDQLLLQCLLFLLLRMVVFLLLRLGRIVGVIDGFEVGRRAPGPGERTSRCRRLKSDSPAEAGNGDTQPPAVSAVGW